MVEEFINVARDLEVLKPQDLTISSRGKQGLRKYLTKEEIDHKLGLMEGSKDKVFLMFLWMSGVRVSEAVGLLKRGLDFRARLMTVRWLKSRKYFERVVPLHPKLAVMVELFVQPLKADDRVFPFTRQRAYQICKKHLGVSPHKLRHSFSAHWIKSGGDLTTLYRVLGHSKIQTTMEYLRIVPADQAKQLERIDF